MTCVVGSVQGCGAVHHQQSKPAHNEGVTDCMANEVIGSLIG